MTTGVGLDNEPARIVKLELVKLGLVKLVNFNEQKGQLGSTRYRLELAR